MQNLSKKTNELINELYRNFIFYIPKKKFNQNILEAYEINIELNHLDNWLDKILYFNDLGLSNYEEETLELSHILYKSSKLNNNVFSLFELKEALERDSFNFILEKYLEQVRFHDTVSRLLINYFDVNCPVTDEQLKTLFNLQYININKHLKEIEKNFCQLTRPLDTKNIDPSIFLKNITIPKFVKTKINITEEKYLRDYILHPKREEIENIIVKRFHNRSARNIRYLIESLEDIKLITLEQGKKKLIYEALRNSFDNNIKAYKSIFGYPINKVENKDFKSLKLELNKSLDGYI